MNYWIEEIIQTPQTHIKMLRYRHDVDHHIDPTEFNTNDQEKFESYRSNKRKLEFYFTRLLWESFGIREEIIYRESGKPIINNGYLSISHSHDCIAIAYSPLLEIGLDIEPVSEKIGRVKHKFSHQEENFNSLTDLTKSWCIKEAVYKLLDLHDIIFMEDIFVEDIQSPAQTRVNLQNEVIKSKAYVIELPNDMIMAYAFAD